MPGPTPRDAAPDPSAVAAAGRYLSASRALRDRSAWPLKMYTTTNLFLWHLDAFAGHHDPLPMFVDVFERSARFLQTAGQEAPAGPMFPAPSNAPRADSNVDVGQSYGSGWTTWTDDDYGVKTRERLVERLAKNGVDPVDLFSGKTVLDAGCGGGNYAAAIAGLGAARVIGIDIGDAGLEFARAQAAKMGLAERLEYRSGSAANIPLADGSVDMVWSNSVVHVTGAYERCIAEFARVLRPGGDLFLYVDGPFGLFGLLMDTLLASVREVPQALFQSYLALLGTDPVRVTWMMANFYVEYERRPAREVEALLRRHGFTELRQLMRGVAIDQIEQVSAGLPYAEVKYGEAQLKYLARKGDGLH